jgi:hypothetical protein
MAQRLPNGSLPSSPEDPRSRAQISYEGEDEFSAMSLDPARKKMERGQQRLTPANPGERLEPQVNELKPTNDQGFVARLRRIFAK